MTRGRKPGKSALAIPLDGLKAARIAAGETLQQAGARIELTKSHYAKAESGAVRLDIARLAVLARAYGVTLESFLPDWASGDTWPPDPPRARDYLDTYRKGGRNA